MWDELIPLASWLLLWVFVYVVMGIFLPYIVAKGFLRYGTPRKTISIKQLYTGGELGPISFMLSLHVALDIFKYKAYSHLIDILFCAAILLLGFCGAWAWANAFCRNLLGQAYDVNRVWSDTRNLAICVCIVGLFIQGFLTLAPNQSGG